MPNSEALCYAYDKVVEGCEEAQSSISVSHSSYRLTSDEVFTVYDAVLDDHPEFFWLIDGVQASGYGNVITTIYLYPPADAAATRAVLEARVNEMTAGLEGKSDYEKSRILHDRLCETVTYAYTDNDQSVFGSLLEGQSVCAGYARAYQLLLQRVGVPAFCVTGYSRAQPHAWNLVQLDGEWYYTDVTWDDQTDNGGCIYYTYLNNTYNQISETHIAVNFAEYLPHSTATAANFYVKNGLVVDPSQPLDIQKLAAGFKATYPPQIYCTGDSTESIYLVFDHLNDIVSKMMGKNTSFSCTGAGMLDRGIVFLLTVDHTHRYATDIRQPSCTLAGLTTHRCTDCGYTTTETASAIGHHKAWATDDTHHTYLCEGCGWIEDSGEHIYDDDTDADCDTCGHLRQIVTVIPGDADNNGKVNNRDLGRLQQYLNEWAVTVDFDACDLDGNGKVNNRDLGLLQRLLNE